MRLLPRGQRLHQCRAAPSFMQVCVNLHAGNCSESQHPDLHLFIPTRVSPSHLAGWHAAAVSHLQPSPSPIRKMTELAHLRLHSTRATDNHSCLLLFTACTKDRLRSAVVPNRGSCGGAAVWRCSGCRQGCGIILAMAGANTALISY